MERPVQVLTLKVRPNTIKRMALWSLVILACLTLLAILPAIKYVITIVIIALFLAFLLDPLVNFIEN
ncbi:MAG: hypothetical protein ACE5HI_07310, partial [bacterium]